LGLAAPYLAVAAFPRLARSMPRPGRWMVRLRQVLGLALAATVVWLLTILPPQIGTTATLVTTGLLVALVAALALGRDGLLTGPLPGRWAAVALALAVVALPLVVRDTAPVGADTSRIPWASFDRDRVRSLVAQGKTVFVDVTAQWCAVCKTNKKFVLDTPDVTNRLRAATVAMRGDWTSPDPKISALLASFGRYGIPFNVVFGPGAPGGVLLPELLTRDAIFAAIDTASGKTAAAVPVR
jgi:suppressor for copper-sensitivity B